MNGIASAAAYLSPQYWGSGNRPGFIGCWDRLPLSMLAVGAASPLPALFSRDHRLFSRDAAVQALGRITR